MSGCVKCKRQIFASSEFALCEYCFVGWPKGYTIEEYINGNIPPDPKVKMLPEHIALTMRRK